MRLIQPESAPNAGNFVLLVLSVWGAVSDNRYKAKGGKHNSKRVWWEYLVGTALIVLLFVMFGMRGVSAGTLGTLTGNLVVWIFAGYELQRFFVRRANPLPEYKK